MGKGRSVAWDLLSVSWRKSEVVCCKSPIQRGAVRSESSGMQVKEQMVVNGNKSGGLDG